MKISLVSTFLPGFVTIKSFNVIYVKVPLSIGLRKQSTDPYLKDSLLQVSRTSRPKEGRTEPPQPRPPLLRRSEST